MIIPVHPIHLPATPDPALELSSHVIVTRCRAALPLHQAWLTTRLDDRVTCPVCRRLARLPRLNAHSGAVR